MNLWNGTSLDELEIITPGDPYPFEGFWYTIDPRNYPPIKDFLPAGAISTPTAVSKPYIGTYQGEGYYPVEQAHIIKSEQYALDEDDNPYLSFFWESKDHQNEFPSIWLTSGSGVSGPGSDGDRDYVCYDVPNSMVVNTITVAWCTVYVPAIPQKYTSVLPSIAAILLLGSFMVTGASRNNRRIK